MSTSTAGPRIFRPDGSLNGSGTATPVRATRDRPLLSPAGRHLRHLKGIAIRNITFKPSKGRRRSNDDENLTTTWRSPSKLAVTLEENAGLPHSKSAIDLKSMGGEGSSVASSSKDALYDDTTSEGGRPTMAKRRSTRANSILAGTIFENAATRQKKLVDATLGRLVDSFFTLHHESIGNDEPFYISEIVPRSINPSFQTLDLSECGPGITRLDSLTLRVWARKEQEKDQDRPFGLMMELSLGLSYLQFIGSSLDKFDILFPENCVIFILSDGCYTIFSELDPKLTKHFSLPKVPSRGPLELMDTCSFDAILKLKNLEDCIYDAKEVQNHLESQMNSIATSRADYLHSKRALGEERLELEDTHKVVAKERKRLDALKKHHEAMKQSISGRKAAIDAGAENRSVAKKHLLNAKQQLQQSQLETSIAATAIATQRKVILDELTKIYPIEHIPSQPLNFTICDLHLPNEPPEGHNEDVIAAALGYVTHLVHILSFYLGVYLRYPVIPKGSNSMVQDPISVIQGSRFFPLWAKGVPYFRFEYAIFLLNKNIEQLMESQNCIVLDIRHTLPNLKYLLYVTTASKTPIIEERPSKPFNLPINRNTATGLASAAAKSGSGKAGKEREPALSQSLPKSMKRVPIPDTDTVRISFKHLRKSQDVL